MGAGYPVEELEVLGRPESNDARDKSGAAWGFGCFGVRSPGTVPKMLLNLDSNRPVTGQPPFVLLLLWWLWELPTGAWMLRLSSSGRLTPESFHGLR